MRVGAVALIRASQHVVRSNDHAVGATAGMSMVRDGRWKHVHYVGHRPQLFDLETDPAEAKDLGESPAHADIRARLQAELAKIVDPEAVNAQAFADEEARMAAHGGPEAIVVAYGRLMERNEAATLTTLKTRRKEVFGLMVATHQGRIFKLTGNGVFGRALQRRRRSGIRHRPPAWHGNSQRGSIRRSPHRAARRSRLDHSRLPHQIG